MNAFILIAAFLLMIVLGFPIAFALGLSSLLYMVINGIPLLVIPQVIASAFESFPLMAIPLFMLAGQLMNSGGITNRIFKFANYLVGHIPGGLGHVNVVASMIFAGMSGSAVADSAGLGSIEIEAMVNEGFDPDFSAAITAASSTIGPVIPPSIPMVLYGSLAGVSVGKLFIGGIIPGVLMGVALMIGCYIQAIRFNYPRHPRVGPRTIAKSFISAAPSLATPAIIIGGIMTGVFTPTEAAGVAVVYALILGIFIYKELTWRDFLRNLLDVGRSTTSIMLIVSMASVFGWVLAYEMIPQQVASAILSYTTNPYAVLFLINIILLIAGCFMETIAIILVLVPMLVPVVNAVGIDLLHFGLVVVLNVMIGLITPPVGVCLYVVADLARISFERVMKATLPFLIILIIVLFIVTYVPSIVTWLPNALGM
ncbi:MAG TPA: TRAP transporter large permease [Bacillota bacterium]|nr:TRAP transporter large permease [Bacillota bacterium]